MSKNNGGGDYVVACCGAPEHGDLVSFADTVLKLGGCPRFPGLPCELIRTDYADELLEFLRVVQPSDGVLFLLCGDCHRTVLHYPPSCTVTPSQIETARTVATVVRAFGYETEIVTVTGHGNGTPVLDTCEGGPDGNGGPAHFESVYRRMSQQTSATAGFMQ